MRVANPNSFSKENSNSVTFNNKINKNQQTHSPIKTINIYAINKESSLTIESESESDNSNNEGGMVYHPNLNNETENNNINEPENNEDSDFDNEDSDFDNEDSDFDNEDSEFDDFDNLEENFDESLTVRFCKYEYWGESFSPEIYNREKIETPCYTIDDLSVISQEVLDFKAQEMNIHPQSLCYTNFHDSDKRQQYVKIGWIT
eukprot:Pgem_evm1s5296